VSVAVEAKNLVKDFGPIRALDNLNFKIEKGEIFGLIGLNGAGKTTALRVTATLLSPTSGTVTVFGHDVSLIFPKRLEHTRTSQGLSISGLWQTLEPKTKRQ